MDLYEQFNLQLSSVYLCSLPRCSDKVFVRVEVIVLASCVSNDIVEFDFVAQKATDSSETFDELEAFRALISDKLNLDSVVQVVHEEPVGKRLLALDLKLDSRLWVLEMFRILLLSGVQELNLGFRLVRLLDLEAAYFNLLKQDHAVKSSHLHRFESVIDTKHNHAGVLSNLVKEFAHNLLFLHKLDIEETVSSQSDCLTEAVILTVRNIEGSEHNVAKTFVELLRSIEFVLKASCTSQHETFHIRPVVCYEVMNRQLTDFADVSIAFFDTLARKTHCGLTTTTVLLRQLNTHSLQHFLVVALESAEKRTITVHNDEAELFVVLKQRMQRFRVESVLALVREQVDRSERLVVVDNFLLRFAIFHQDDTAENVKTIFWSVLV